MWMTNDDPIMQKEIEKMPLIAYYFRLNKKAEDVKKAAKIKPMNMQSKWQNK